MTFKIGFNRLEIFSLKINIVVMDIVKDITKSRKSGNTRVVITLLFSSPEPSGSQGELIVNPCSVVRPSVRRPSVVHHFQRSQILHEASMRRGNQCVYK